MAVSETAVLAAGNQGMKLAENRDSRKLASRRQYETLSCSLRLFHPLDFGLRLRNALSDTAGAQLADTVIMWSYTVGMKFL